jgi:hypothetical protein
LLGDEQSIQQRSTRFSKKHIDVDTCLPLTPTTSGAHLPSDRQLSKIQEGITQIEAKYEESKSEVRDNYEQVRAEAKKEAQKVRSDSANVARTRFLISSTGRGIYNTLERG